MMRRSGGVALDLEAQWDGSRPGVVASGDKLSPLQTKGKTERRREITERSMRKVSAPVEAQNWPVRALAGQPGEPDKRVAKKRPPKAEPTLA